MVLPRWLAKANRKITNPVLQRIPARVAPFAVVHHVGRRSGKAYSVPVAAFPTSTGFLLPPTYGPKADWVRNVIAAGTFAIDRRGRAFRLDNARLVGRSEAWPNLPMLVRSAMRVLHVEWFVAADRT